MFSILLFAIRSRVCRAAPSTEPAFFISCPNGWLQSKFALSTTDFKNYATFWCRHWRTVVPFLVDSPCVAFPVQSAVQVNSQESVFLNQLHLFTYRMVVVFGWFFVQFVFKMRRLFPHQATKWSTSSLYSASCPSLIHLIYRVFLEMYWKSEVDRVKRNCVLKVLERSKNMILTVLSVMSRWGWVRWSR